MLDIEQLKKDSSNYGYGDANEYSLSLAEVINIIEDFIKFSAKTGRPYCKFEGYTANIIEDCYKEDVKEYFKKNYGDGIKVQFCYVPLELHSKMKRIEVNFRWDF